MEGYGLWGLPNPLLLHATPSPQTKLEWSVSLSYMKR